MQRQMHWAPITTSSSEPNSLFVATCEVARLSQRLDGSWFATLTIPDQPPVHRDCTTYQTGRAGCVAWAQRHMDAIVAAAEEHRLQWLEGRRFG